MINREALDKIQWQVCGKNYKYLTVRNEIIFGMSKENKMDEDEKNMVPFSNLIPSVSHLILPVIAVW